MTIEWVFVALNFIGIFFYLIILTGTIRNHLKTRHKTPFWLIFSILMFLLIIRGLGNIVYEIFGFTVFGGERINIAFIIVASFFIFAYVLLIKRTRKRFKKSLKRKHIGKKSGHKVKEKKAEKKEAHELKEELKIVEESYKAGVISLENYEKDKTNIMGLLEKHEENEQLRERVKKIEQFILETEESSEFEDE